MDILDRILSLLGDREQKELTDYLGLKSVAFSDWKSGKSSSYRKYLIEISEFFGVSIDYLVYGDDHFSSNIANSTIGAVGNHSTGTVNVQPNSINSKNKEATQNDEMTQEIMRILNELPLKERTKLLSMVYDFEEQYQKTQNEKKN